MKKNMSKKHGNVEKRIVSYSIFILVLFCSIKSFAQSKPQMIRIARIVVDSAQLENYKAALKEGIETAVRVEPGVLSLNAVYDKARPTHITVFEVYTDTEAYQFHIQTAHFKKYKSITQPMVKLLELIDVDPIAMASKPKQN